MIRGNHAGDEGQPTSRPGTRPPDPEASARGQGPGSRLIFALLSGACGFLAIAAALIVHPATPLPAAWNPIHPLRVSDPVTPLTGWKLRRALSDGAVCLAAMDDVAVQALPPLQVSDGCGIDPRVSLSRVGAATLSPVETDCAVALRLAMWEAHSLQPAAQAILGEPVTRIEHLSSYSCRPIRTPAGDGARMSTHATAEAIDISGFVLADGRSVTLSRDWGSSDPGARAFLREARDGACRWFATTLGPDYNALHADHFHLQARGWGLCR